MPQTKLQLLDEARKLGLKVEPSTKMADIRVLIAEKTAKPVASEKSEAKTEVETVETKEKAPAKAGKRSAKVSRETEELAVKKASTEAKAAAPKSAPKTTRSKLERRAKNYRKLAEKIEANKIYTLNEAIGLAKTTSPTKFDAAVELHVNLSVDPRQAEQNIRDNVLLPAGSGKKLKIAVLSDDAAQAGSAGADLAGGDDILEQIAKGNIDFDILIATPSFMPKLGKYAKLLGPKGLMPNPKSGTVTTDVKKAVAEAKAGRVEYRVDAYGIVHLSVGRVSFDESGLRDNIMAVITSIRANKPSNVKSNYMKSVYLTSSMGPSISVDMATLSEA